MATAIIYERRDWGLVEVQRLEKMSEVNNVIRIPYLDRLVEDVYTRFGKLPTGEIMYLKDE